MKFNVAVLLVVFAGLMNPAVSEASLSTFQSFVGTVGVSTDGFGSTGNSGTISASVPAGATVLGAYLYTSTYTFDQPPTAPGGTLNGSGVSYSSIGGYFPDAAFPGFSLQASRADVTSIVAPVINGGSGGTYNFAVTETSSLQDGEALVVVYSLASLPVATVGILDGFSTSGGDTTAINFATPLAPSAPGFFADMALGIGFSCCDQKSTVTVNGTTITQNAGQFDDGVSGASNGALITVGGFNDPFSPFNPSYADDHERYNLVPYISNGDTSIVIRTVNPSLDDNIFLAVFNVSGEAVINEPPTIPEPGTLSLVGLGGAAAFRAIRRRRRKA